MHRLVVCSRVAPGVRSYSRNWRALQRLQRPLPSSCLLSPAPRPSGSASVHVRPRYLCSATGSVDSSSTGAADPEEGGKGGGGGGVPADLLNIKSRKKIVNELKHQLTVDSGIHEKITNLVKESGELVYESPGSRVAVAKEMWDMLKEKGWKFNVGMYNTLMQVYLSNDQPFVPSEITTEMQDDGITPNQETFELLHRLYCRSGDLESATGIEERMKSEGLPINENVYASLITGHARNGDMTSAEDMLGVMEQNGLRPGLTSYTALLTAHAEKGDLEAIQRLFSEMKSKSLMTDMLPYLKVIDTLSKHGHTAFVSKALGFIQNKKWMQQDLRNIAYQMASRGEIDSCLELLTCITKSPAHIDTIIMRGMVSEDKPIGAILASVKSLQEQGFSGRLYDELIRELFLKERWDDVVCVLEEMHTENLEIRTLYLYPYFAQRTNQKDVDGLMHGLRLVRRFNLHLDYILQSFILDTFGKENLEKFISLLKKDVSYFMGGELMNSMLYFLASYGPLSALPGLITEMVDKESLRVGYLLRGLQKSRQLSCVSDLVGVYRAILSLGLEVSLDRNIYLVTQELLNQGCVQEACQLAEKLLEMGEEPDSLMYKIILIHMNENEMTNEFKKFLEMLDSKGVVLDTGLYKQILWMSSVSGNSFLAETAKSILQERGSHNTYISYSHYIIASAKAGKLRQALRSYEEAVGMGLKLYPRAYAELISMLIKHGNVTAAEEIRKEMNSRDIKCNYFMHGDFLHCHAMRGDITKARAEFEELKKNEDATMSSFSYSKLMSAYSFHGDHASIRKLIKEAESEGIPLHRAMVTCLVEAYINCDDLDSALAVPKELPVQPFYTTYLLLLEALVNKGQDETSQGVKDVIADIEKLGVQEPAGRDLLLFAHVKAGQIDKARDLLRKEGNPPVGKKNFAPFVRKCLYSDGNGKPDDVSKSMKLIREEKAYSEELFVDMIKAYQSLKDFDGALSFQKELEDQGLQPPEEFYSVLRSLSFAGHDNTQSTNSHQMEQLSSGGMHKASIAT